MRNLIVPIVFSSNDQYAMYCYMAIYSLVKNISEENIYKIYVLQTDISKQNCEILESLSCDNVEVKCIDILSFISDVELRGSLHLTVETYYRLFIPRIFPQYDKILYLDSDMCVLEDVAELYKVDIGDFPIGAVADVKTKHLRAHSWDIGKLDFTKTFNAGVLLINVKLFEEEKVCEKCLELLAEDYKRKERKFVYADQDALNVVLYKKWYVLDDKWNYQPQYLWRTEEICDFAREQYVMAQNAVNIMHFSGEKKPWQYPEMPQAMVFWRYAKETVYFQKLLICIMETMREEKRDLRCFDIYKFPYDMVTYKSKVILYAAGDVGKSFYKQIQLSDYAKLVLWADKNWKNFAKEMNIKPITAISNVEYDYIIIAIDSKVIAEKVKEKLITMGVPTFKIVWKKYRKTI